MAAKFASGGSSKDKAATVLSVERRTRGRTLIKTVAQIVLKLLIIRKLFIEPNKTA